MKLNATHLLCQSIYVRAGPVIHYCVSKHKVYVSLVLRGVGDAAVLSFGLDGLEIYWTFHVILVVWSFGFFDGIVENTPAAMGQDLTVQKSDDVLKALIRLLFFGSAGA